MMTRNLLVRCAPLAIAASGVLYAIPTSAQDATAAAPVIVLPEPAPATPAPAAAPTIVLPAATSAPEPAPVREVAAPAPVASQQARTTAPRNVAQADAAPVAQAPVSVASPAPVAPVAVSPAPAIAEVSPATNTAEVPVATTTADSTGEIAFAALLGALGLAAVGGVAFVAARRRRRVAEHHDEALAYDAVYHEPEVDEPVETRQPVVTARNPEPVFTTPAPVASAFTAPVIGAAPAERAEPKRVSGDPIALPQEAPESFEERDALLKELVSAEPDKANPFTSPRARARRAKLIIQSLSRDFTSRKPRIDLSEYTNRWPALRGWQPATA